MGNLAAVCAYFNPCHYQSRRRNYDEFRRRIEDSGVALLTVELIFDPEQPSELGQHGNVLSLYGGDVMWQKERLLQIGIDQLLTTGYDPIAWMDADIVFEGREWHQRVVGALDQFDCVQSFDRLVSHYPDRRLVRASVVKDRRSFAHGGGWAARADFWRKMPLYQHCIVGGGDSVMANVLLQSSNSTVPGFRWPEDDVVLWQLNPKLRAHATSWANQVRHPFRVSYVVGQTAHLLPHGSRRNRYYLERWRAIADFDPEQDVRVSESGAFRWASDKPQLRRAVRRYFEVRREDDE